MNYKLAKELKDAGFPQTENCLSCKHKILYIDEPGYGCQKCKEDDYIYHPILSELIDACGEDIISLNRVVKDKKYIKEVKIDPILNKYPMLESDCNTKKDEYIQIQELKNDFKEILKDLDKLYTKNG